MVWDPIPKVGGKGFVRLKEDGRSVVFMLEDVEEQEALIESRPKIYYITDHYRGWPAVLARLSALGTAEARVRLERAWRKKASPRLRRQLDGEPTAPPPRRARRPARSTGRSPPGARSEVDKRR